MSPLVPPDIQALQRDVWAYSTLSDLMAGYVYAFAYLCSCIGFRLDPQDSSQIKLYLCWQWS